MLRHLYDVLNKDKLSFVECIELYNLATKNFLVGLKRELMPLTNGHLLRAVMKTERLNESLDKHATYQQLTSLTPDMLAKSRESKTKSERQQARMTQSIPDAIIHIFSDTPEDDRGFERHGRSSGTRASRRPVSASEVKANGRAPSEVPRFCV